MAEDNLTPPNGYDWEASEDLTALSGTELGELLGRVSEEERAAQYRYEVLRGRAALIRAELAGRGLASLSSEELAGVLLSGLEEGEVGPA